MDGEPSLNRQGRAVPGPRDRLAVRDPLAGKRDGAAALTIPLTHQRTTNPDPAAA